MFEILIVIVVAVVVALVLKKEAKWYCADYEVRWDGRMEGGIRPPPGDRQTAQLYC